MIRNNIKGNNEKLIIRPNYNFILIYFNKVNFILILNLINSNNTCQIFSNYFFWYFKVF